MSRPLLLVTAPHPEFFITEGFHAILFKCKFLVDTEAFKSKFLANPQEQNDFLPSDEVKLVAANRTTIRTHTR